MIFLAAISPVLSQDVTLECQFLVSIFDEYACALIGVTLTDPELSVTLVGEHVGNRTNEDVDVVFIMNSDTPFTIPEIFTTFPNMIELEIDFANLQSINIPDTVRLQWLDIFGNNVERVESDSFVNQTDLEFCFLSLNSIQTIAGDAFEGIDVMLYLELVFNDIEEFEPLTFQPLTEVLILDFEGNLLRSVDNIFTENRQLWNLYFEYNQINEIHPSLYAALEDNLEVSYLYGNICINRGFYFQDEVEFALLHSSLRTCYLNFNGTEITEDKDFGMRFSGFLRVYDEFNNLIGSL